MKLRSLLITWLPAEWHEVDLAVFDAPVTVVAPAQWAFWYAKPGADSSPAVLASSNPFVAYWLIIIVLSLVINVRDCSGFFDAVAMDIWLVLGENFWVISAAWHAGTASVSEVILWASTGDKWQDFSLGHSVLGEGSFVVGDIGAFFVDSFASFISTGQSQGTGFDVITIFLVEVLVLEQ